MVIAYHFDKWVEIFGLSLGGKHLNFSNLPYTSHGLQASAPIPWAITVDLIHKIRMRTTVWSLFFYTCSHVNLYVKLYVWMKLCSICESFFAHHLCVAHLSCILVSPAGIIWDTHPIHTWWHYSAIINIAHWINAVCVCKGHVYSYIEWSWWHIVAH